MHLSPSFASNLIWGEQALKGENLLEKRPVGLIKLLLWPSAQPPVLATSRKRLLKEFQMWLRVWRLRPRTLVARPSKRWSISLMKVKRMSKLILARRLKNRHSLRRFTRKCTLKVTWFSSKWLWISSIWSRRKGEQVRITMTTRKEQCNVEKQRKRLYL